MEHPNAPDLDSAGVFVPGPAVSRAGEAAGPLAGRSLGVKDLYDVEGAVTGFGNPDWGRLHGPAVATAPVVLALLEAGASLVGKTKTVELAYGLSGENAWYGTPRNPLAPECYPGGSSCGSAAGVAGGAFDIGLGSDTGGSVRIPASYCGAFGIRPSQGAVSLAGACALAPSLDTPGWFARDAVLLRQVGDVLLPPDRPGLGSAGGLGPLLRFEEAWENADFDVAAALFPMLARLERDAGAAVSLRLLPEGPAALYRHVRAVQGQEVWATLGGWISGSGAVLSDKIAARFAAARAVAPEAAAAGRAYRRALSGRVRGLLAGGGVLAFPTSPVPAPLLSASDAELEQVRERTVGISGLTALCGLCEVTLPVAVVRGTPVGLSLAAAPGADRALLAFATRAAAVLAD